MTISELTLESSDLSPRAVSRCSWVPAAAQMVAGAESANRSGKVRCRRDRECGGSAIPSSPQQICAWRRAAGLPVAEVSAPEALFGPTVVAAPVSEPAGTVAAETAETPPDIVPAQLRVIVVRRLKYACRASEEVVVQAPAPAQMIEGGLRPSRRSRGCW